MHAYLPHSTGTQRRDGQGGGRLSWRLAAVLALGLALGPPPYASAKTFPCGAGDVQCLIDAIHEANANGQRNTIRLAAGTYTLTAVDNTTDADGPNGLPSITGKIILRGTGAETTSLERVFTGQFSCPIQDDDKPRFRLLHVASTGVLTIEDLTLRGGCTAFATAEDRTFPGGGIANRGHLTVTDSTIAHNESGEEFGGGIWSVGTLTVLRSLITNNGGDGGGGIAAAGHTVIAHSSIVENRGFAPAGINNFDGTMHITDSTIAWNREEGILNAGTLTILNSTITENTSFAPDRHFGIENQEGPLSIVNSTIAWNASGGLGNISFALPPNFGTVTVQNTILAQNTVEAPPSSSSGGPDCGGPITSLGTNLLGDPTDCLITLQASDLTGDPGLADWTDNGRPGNGHVPLLPTSQAIDAGNEAACPLSDQLGHRRVGPCDIGAVEFISTAP
jgi:hypothetical protein